VSPDGKVLASHQNFKSEKTWPKEVLADLRPGLAAFGPVTARHFHKVDPLPHRGVGYLKDGGVCLGVYLRYSIKGIPLRELPNPTIDSLVLTAEEWQAFLPAAPKAGHTWKISQTVARKFSRILGPGDEDSMPRPHEVKPVRFTGKVQKMKNGVAYLAYEGGITGAHNTQSNKGLCHGDAKLTGVARWDVKTKRLLAMTLVFDGVFRNVRPYDQPAKYSGVVEWRQR
jgi:hypothetical protein